MFVKTLLVASVLTSLVAPVALAAAGDTVMKVRLVGTFPVKSQIKNAMTSTTATTAAAAALLPANTDYAAGNVSEKLVKNGFGVDISGTYFFTDNLASEFSLGMICHKYNDRAVNLGGAKNKAFTFPLTATAQYHVMPGSQVSPYVGAGVAYIFTHSGKDVVQGARINKGFGGVVQLGLDVKASDMVGFNLDVKKYFMRNKTVNVGKVAASGTNFVNTKGDVTKKYSPIVLSAGVSFKF
jgi:outer membrane protein W